MFCWQKRFWTLGSLAYSLSVGVKMNTLLALPAVGVIYLLALGRDKALKQALIMVQLQVRRAEFPTKRDTGLTAGWARARFC